MPRNSVGTLQLKRNAVTSSKIAPNVVRTAHVVNGTLHVDDFKAGQIPQGPRGDKGDKGDRGATGPVGITGYEIVRVTKTVNANTIFSSIVATCPAGKKVIGGAGSVQGINPGGVFLDPDVIASATGLPGDDAYAIQVYNSNTTPRVVDAVAICARVAA